MLTVVETLLFQRQWPLYWTEEERGAFAAYIAPPPEMSCPSPAAYGKSVGEEQVRASRAVCG
jgi:hypothetical protein